MTGMTRRAFLAGTTALALPRMALSTGASQPFGREQVITLARDTAAHPYMPREEVPKDWRDLSYEQYKSIWFRHTSALWRDTEVK